MVTLYLPALTSTTELATLSLSSAQAFLSLSKRG